MGKRTFDLVLIKWCVMVDSSGKLGQQQGFDSKRDDVHRTIDVRPETFRPVQAAIPGIPVNLLKFSPGKLTVKHSPGVNFHEDKTT
jgi:hypothetical protein